MVEYHSHSVHLSEPQKKVLASGGTVKLSHVNLVGDHLLHFTSAQMKKMKKAHEAGKGTNMRFSVSQLKHHKKTGGNILHDILNGAKKLLLEHGPGLAKKAISLGVNKIAENLNKGGKKTFGAEEILKNGLNHLLDEFVKKVAKKHGSDVSKHVEAKLGSGFFDSILSGLGKVAGLGVKDKKKGGSFSL